MRTLVSIMGASLLLVLGSVALWNSLLAQVLLTTGIAGMVIPFLVMAVLVFRLQVCGRQ
jgi:hypothetical protein